MKPTKEEMLDWLRFKSEGFDDDDPEYKAIRSLIEKSGDGGSVVSREWLNQFIKEDPMSPTKVPRKMTQSSSAFLLQWFNYLIREYSPNGLTTEGNQMANALRSLIEKYGDGGPRVKADEVRRMIQDAYEEVGGEGISYKVLFNWLRSIGVEVEEKP